MAINKQMAINEQLVYKLLEIYFIRIIRGMSDISAIDDTITISEITNLTKSDIIYINDYIKNHLERHNVLCRKYESVDSRLQFYQRCVNNHNGLFAIIPVWLYDVLGLKQIENKDDIINLNDRIFKEKLYIMGSYWTINDFDNDHIIKLDKNYCYDHVIHNNIDYYNYCFKVYKNKLISWLDN